MGGTPRTRLMPAPRPRLTPRSARPAAAAARLCVPGKLSGSPAATRAARKPKHCASSASPSQPTASTGSTGAGTAARSASMIAGLCRPPPHTSQRRGGTGRRRRCHRGGDEGNERGRPVRRRQGVETARGKRRGEIQPVDRFRRRPGEIGGLHQPPQHRPVRPPRARQRPVAVAGGTGMAPRPSRPAGRCPGRCRRPAAPRRRRSR